MGSGLGPMLGFENKKYSVRVEVKGARLWAQMGDRVPTSHEDERVGR